MDNLSRSMAAAIEEFASLKEKVEFVCDVEPTANYNWQLRKPDKWGGQQEKEKDKPVYYCFAVSHRPWSLRNDDLSRDELKNFIIKVFILVPEHCSLYHFADFIASSKGIACVAANSKIYLFGGGCGTGVWYRDVVGKGDNSKQGKDWEQAKACFNREKHNPLSFSLGNKIYALETCYLLTSDGDFIERNRDVSDDDDDYRFEVLDTSSDDDSCWLPLCNPPYPFGGSQVFGSWSSGDQGDGYRIFIDAFSSVGGNHLFVYDVDTDTWDKFKRDCSPKLVDSPVKLDCSPFYTWALHSIGKDFAPFPPQVPFTGDLRVLTGLKRSIPELHQLTSECQQGLFLPFPVKVETDRKEKVSVPCTNSSRCLTGWDLESLWTLHCLPVDCMTFWQAIHLGGSSFCTLAYYIYTFCCARHSFLYVRVANFDITDVAAAGGASEPVFSAEYGANKVYLLSKAALADPLPCSKLQPI